MPRPSPRTATDCWMARWPGSFSPRCCRKTRSKPCCRAIISRSSLPGAGRGHLAGSLGEPEELSPKGRLGRATRPGTQRRAGLSRRASNQDTHASTTDPDARLYRKGPGKEARLCFIGHALMENRNGLVIGAVTTRASGHAERLAALALIDPHADRPQPVTLGADKGYDTGDFVMELRDKTVTPHVAQNQNGRRSAIDGRTTRHPGYAVSSVSANASKKFSAGPRRWPACARCAIAGCPRSIGNSPSPWPPTISSPAKLLAEPCRDRPSHSPANIPAPLANAYSRLR